MPILIKGWTTAGVQALERPTPHCLRVQHSGLVMVSYSSVLCMPCTHVRFSFNAGTGVVSGGECPDEGSAEPDVKGDGRDLTNLAQRRIRPHGEVSDSRGRRLMEKSRFLQDP